MLELDGDLEEGDDGVVSDDADDRRDDLHDDVDDGERRDHDPGDPEHEVDDFLGVEGAPDSRNPTNATGGLIQVTARPTSSVIERIWRAERARATTPAMQAMLETIEQLRVAGKMVTVGIRFNATGQLGVVWACAGENTSGQVADVERVDLEARPAGAGPGEMEWPDDRRAAR
jgi:hypothetical protein